MKLEGKDVWASVTRKAFSSLLGAICGAGLSYLLLWLNKDFFVLVVFVLLCLALLLIVYTRYVASSSVNRSLRAGFLPYLARDTFKALFNTLLFSTAAFKLTLSIYASNSTVDDSFYKALPEHIQNQISFNSPWQQGLWAVSITFVLYMLFNVVMNFINADSEKKAKEMRDAQTT